MIIYFNLIEIYILFRPKPLPDGLALRRMQNRWETEILQHEVPRTAPIGRNRDRWETSNDTQIPSSDTQRSMTAPQSK